jgi:hypothetical protein
LATREDPRTQRLKGKKVLFIGASIVQCWYIHEYFDFIHSLSVYKFDKTEEIQGYLALNGLNKKPDVVVLKECAAFIPLDIERFELEFTEYKSIYKGMIEVLKKNNIIPIIATVCPIAYKGPHLNNILKFNNWLREYAKSNSISILDMEKSVRISERDRRLRSEISQEDGLHLKREAYENYLNPLVVPLILDVLEICN